MKEAQKSSEDAAAGKHRLDQLIHALVHKLQHTQKAVLTAQRQR